MTILFVLNIWACACAYLVLVHRKLLRHCGNTTGLATFLDPADTSGDYVRIKHFQLTPINTDPVCVGARGQDERFLAGHHLLVSNSNSTQVRYKSSGNRFPMARSLGVDQHVVVNTDCYFRRSNLRAG